MLTHYFTLHALSAELNAALTGGEVREAFTQQKNELLFTIALASKAYCLCLSVEPSFNYVFYRDTFARARKNTVDIFEALPTRTVTGVALDADDRIIRISFSGEMTLSARLYNSADSNVLLSSADGTVMEAFKHDKNLKGTRLPEREARFDRRVLENRQTFESRLQKEPADSVYKGLKSTVPILGSTLAREVLHRCRIAESIPSGSLTSEQVEALSAGVREIVRELDNPRPVVYYRGDTPAVLSVVPLRHLAGAPERTFESANQAVRTFATQSFRRDDFERDKSARLARIGHILDEERRGKNAAEKQLKNADRADDYARVADLIMANLQHLTKGTREVDLPRQEGGKESIRISLDPLLTPIQNAKRYYEKGKRARADREDLERRIALSSKKIADLEKMLLHLDNCRTAEHMREFESEYSSSSASFGLIGSKEKKPEHPFREFKVAGDLEVLVGKSAAQNDQLTMQYARPNDLWFHVRGAGGSHTILRTSGKSVPSRDAVMQAAAIAAYYSKMRKAKNVPVAYCERKYVRKPRKAPAGTVILEREKVVFVNPALP